MNHDPVSAPAHYTRYPVQPIAITRHLGFCLGNAVKYALRAPYKDNGQQDLRKALQYLTWEAEAPAPALSVNAYEAMEAALDDLVFYLIHKDHENISAEEDAIMEAQADFLREVGDYLYSHSPTDLANVCHAVDFLAQTLEARHG